MHTVQPDLTYFEKLGINVATPQPATKDGNVVVGILWGLGLQAVMALIIWGAVSGWRYVGR